MDARQQQQQQLQQVNNATHTMLNSTLNQNQHYGAEANETALATPANSIQFLDSDGCPTDANLMGPLVRMDPHGHRLLAPFDAFKFPTSDMVFFRAVVSSCVAECKPALCPSSVGSTSGSGASAPQGQPPAPMILSDLTIAPFSPYGELASSSLTTPDDDSDLFAATTRNMQTSSPPLTTRQQSPPPPAGIGTTKRFVPTASTNTTSTTAAPSSQQQLSSDRGTTMPAAGSGGGGGFETLERTTKQQAATMSSSTATDGGSGGGSSGGGDLLTTVPGFRVDQEQSSTTAASNLPASLSSSSAPDIGAQAELSRVEQQHATINMTNNHNLGRPSPRPLTTTTTLDDSDLHRSSSGGGNHAPERHPVGPYSPAKLDPLTAQERQAILNLLSGHDKLPSSLLSASPSETHVISPTPIASSQLHNEETITSGLMKLYPILDSFRHGNSRSRGLVAGSAQGQHQHTQQPISSRMVLNEIRAIISDQYQLGDISSANGNSSSISSSITSGQRDEPPRYTATAALPRSQKSKRSHLPFADNRQFVEFINRTLIDYIIAEELKSLLLTQMLLDETSNSLPVASGAGKSARLLSTHADDAPNKLMFPLERLNKFYDKMSWPRITPVSPDGHLLSVGPEVPDAAQPSLTFLQAQRLVKAQFDNQLAIDIQHILKLLDDTKHLDARQEIKRNKRQVEEDNLMISNNYVYLSQPQRGPHPAAASAGAAAAVAAVSGHVEMYRGERSLHAAARRFKRHDTSQTDAVPSSEFDAHSHDGLKSEPEGPKYEMDEMIVQSIKIVDRLQFEDELMQQQQQRPRHTNSSRSSTRQDNKWATTTTMSKRKQMRAKYEGSTADLANEVPQAQLGDLIPADSSSDQPDQAQAPTAPRSKLSAINVILVALCFIFIQVSMVLVCVIDWNRQRKQQMSQQQTRSLFANLGPAVFSSTGLPAAAAAHKRGHSSSLYCSSVADTPSFPAPAASWLSYHAATLRPTQTWTSATTSRYNSARNKD